MAPPLWLLLGHKERPTAGEEPAASREGISPALGSPRHEMRDVGASYAGARGDVHTKGGDDGKESPKVDYQMKS